MRKTDEIIAALNCFKTRQPKCGGCPYNPRPGREWPYGCIAGQGRLIDDAKELIQKLETKNEEWEALKANERE